MLCHIRGAGWPIVEIAQSKDERAQLEESDEEKKSSSRVARGKVFKISQAVGARVETRPRI